MADYLNYWYEQVQGLEGSLNDRELEILNEINPHSCQHYWIHSIKDVKKLIERHSPQLWRWKALFPGLTDLNPEEEEILDHFPVEQLVDTSGVPFSLNTTEKDVRTYLKMKIEERRLAESEAALKRYQEHLPEINALERKSAQGDGLMTFSSLVCGYLVSLGASAYPAAGKKALAVSLAGITIFGLVWTWATSGSRARAARRLIALKNKLRDNKPRKGISFGNAILLFLYSVFIFGTLLGFGAVLGHVTAAIAMTDYGSAGLVIGLGLLGAALVSFILTAIFIPKIE